MKAELERPRVFFAVAFNAEQIEGLPHLEIKAPEWDRHERAAAVLKASGIEIGYDPGQHATYVDSWIKVLKCDPKEILRAARDADEITGYLLWLEKERRSTSIGYRCNQGAVPLSDRLSMQMEPMNEPIDSRRAGRIPAIAQVVR